MAFSLHGERVIVRDWRDSDLEAYAALNADPEVRRFFPTVLNREQSDAEIGRMREHAEREGFTFWAVEVPGVAELIGFTGLLRPPLPHPFHSLCRNRLAPGSCPLGQGLRN
ncbi:GNAT family N-acetyltransferase [Chitinimonas viridis]|uniref:GNAT family N-acetyltransferase n=1 Tax=Chitinimonas viridis TaxID=664880 RepID=UPI0027E56C03|nr:GNAT family N-acetyltransferase [Chitinimonas viridis]